MVAFQIFLLAALTSLKTATALNSNTNGAARPRLVFPKVGETVILPTVQGQESRPPLLVQGVLPPPQTKPVRRYAVHEDTVPAAYHHHQDPAAYHHQDGGSYHHQDGGAYHHQDNGAYHHKDNGAYHHHWDGGDDSHHHYPHDPPKYAYKYSVNDEHTGDSKQAWEHRDGDVTHGGYTVLDPDGHLRIVEYTVTKKGGFQAKVRREPIY